MKLARKDTRRAIVAGGAAALAALGYAAWDRRLFSGPAQKPKLARDTDDAGAARPNLPTLAFSPQYIVAKDGTRLRAAVFKPDRPRELCVLLPGLGEFIEKYVEVIGELNARGFTVATLDWRGHGGSARPLADPLKAYVRDFAEYDDDLTTFRNEVVKPIATEPPLVLAHSMGAHILLRTLHRSPGAFRAAVLTAPMLGLSTRGYPRWMTRAVPALYGAIGESDEYAWGLDKDPIDLSFEEQHCTGDRGRYARTRNIIAAHPSLRQKGATWEWITSVYRSIETVTAPGFAEAITTPVLFVGAGRDRVALPEAGRRFAKRLPHCTYLELNDAEHEILMERDDIRARFWRAFDGFVAQG